MSIIRKTPYIETMVSEIKTANDTLLTALKTKLNDTSTASIEASLDNLPSANTVTLVNFSLRGKTENGILVRTATKCYLITYKTTIKDRTDINYQYIRIFKINTSLKTIEEVDEYFTIDELRKQIEIALVGSQGHDLTPDELMGILDPQFGINIEKNTEGDKVIVEIDGTVIDETPTENSANLVKSSGVYDAIHGLTASDIMVTNAQSVQANLERIDLDVGGLIDDVADLGSGKLNASKDAVATVGGLVTPAVAPSVIELVGIDSTGAQVRIQIDTNDFEFDGSTSPYTLKKKD